MVFGLFWIVVVVVSRDPDSAGTDDPGSVIITPVTALSPTAAASANGSSPSPGPTSAPAPTATPSATALTGFAFPIAGGCLPKGDQLMPNAPRTYRNGIHEGVDFYQVDNCTAISRGTEVLAAKAGRVIRSDLSYVDPTQAEINAYLADPNTEASLDKFRGRQVWIMHEGGTVTRYAHLSGIASGIVSGASVSRGQVVAYVGESGTPESVSNPGTEYHLHFEVRVGDSYLGQGQPPTEVRRLYQAVFAP